jgi:2-amino-4-hydroxy-6-hydroxymethyldihydropteridine diphosphokinase/dihydropteroate synthase
MGLARHVFIYGYAVYLGIADGVKVETTLGPIELLDALQAIENGLGRYKTIDKGPRVIDLDILLYDHETVSHPRLNIPHKLMLERDFVLRPLCQ